MAGTVSQRREYAEEAARRGGYDGPWPPPQVRRPQSAVELRTAIDQLARGEHRAGVTRMVGFQLANFTFELQPEDFQRAAEVVIRIARNPKNSTTTRLRAIRAGIIPLRNAVALASRLRRRGQNVAPELAGHVCRCLVAFCDGLGPEGPGELAKLGRSLLRTSKGTQALAVVQQLYRAHAEAVEALTVLGWKPSRPHPTASSRLEIDAEIERLLAEYGD